MDKKLYVYSQSDMQMVTDFINALTFQGVTMARRVSAIATILESGRPLEDYLKDGKDGGTDGVLEALHPENMEE